jgi:hypothetical protein
MVVACAQIVIAWVLRDGTSSGDRVAGECGRQAVEVDGKLQRERGEPQIV